MKIGGPKSVINAVQKAGGEVGPRVMWVGSWNLKDGYDSLRSFYRDCKASGLQPLVHFWFFGDDISHAALVNGVQDKHQNVWKDWALARQQALTIARMAKEEGVTPIVTMESEFNKAGAETSQKMIDYLWDMRTTLKKELPAIQLVFAPGLWGDLKGLATRFKDVAQSMDYIGVQAVKFPPRHGDYTGEPQRIRDGLATLRSVIGAKPACLHDVALSTYDSSQKVHPFADGHGSAHDRQQAVTLQGLGGLGVEFMVYRDLKDNPTFQLSNYGGHAERHVGVIRADGSRKPGYDVLLSLALPPKPDPAPEPKPEPEPVPDPQPTGPTLEQRIKSLEDEVSTLRSQQENLSNRLGRAASEMQGGVE